MGAGLSYSYGRLLYNALQVDGISYPELHETKLRSVLRMALEGAENVLEVGIGRDCRLIRRGFYPETRKINIVGVDVVDVPIKNQILAKAKLHPESSLDIVKGSISGALPFDDQSFDAIICCLTLCSVDDPSCALREMKRLLRKGGRFGYLEHVAVNDDEPFRLLEAEQRLLDPLQQVLAENCHLHRFTEDSIRSTFQGSSSLLEERFIVDSMWPVSCQSCGVLSI